MDTIPRARGRDALSQPHLVSRRSFVFARAGFGKSNLVKLLFANLYAGQGPPRAEAGDREVPVGTVIFDPDGESFWPDYKGRPGCATCRRSGPARRLHHKQGPSEFYGSFFAEKVRLDIRDSSPPTSSRGDTANARISRTSRS